MYRTTRKHFKQFKSECRYWLNAFGLLGWCVSFFHEMEPDGNLAWESHNVPGRIASLGLSTEWEQLEPNKHEIRRVAFHEVCELLLARLDTEAKYRFAVEDNINEARHAVIRTLEHVVWECHEHGGMSNV